jgi:HD-GYP domain-containing protein (c-di-GMP phosphodiesterase class II)
MKTRPDLLRPHFVPTGHPDGLMEEDIPIGARIIAIAHAYQVMIDRNRHQNP